MSDNQEVSSTPYDVATDKVSYSGDADRNLQLMRDVEVTGSEGSKTVEPLDKAVVSGNARRIVVIGDPTTADVVTILEGGALKVGFTGSVAVQGLTPHDDTAAQNPALIGGWASAAAPTNVSADDDAVRAWFLRNGALVNQLSAAGALIGGDATNGLDVDVTRLPALVAGTANIGDVDVLTLPALPAGTNNIGDVDVLTLPADPLGANADAVVAAGAAGSISAKLRRISQGLEDLKTLVVLGAGTANIGDVDVLTLPALPTGTNNIGDVDVLTVPADPFGATADAAVAAGATGSISAKLRRISQSIEDLKTTALVAGTANIGDVDVLTLPNVTIGTMAALVAGSAAIGKLAANSGVDIGDVDVTSLPALAAGSAAIGSVSMDASAANGCDVFRSIDLDESEEDVKTSAGTLYGWYIVNRATTPRYVKLYNATAANTTVGTTTPVMVLPIPGSTTNYVGANMAFAPGIKFATAICAAATTGVADNDTGAPAANDVVVNLMFK